MWSNSPTYTRRLDLNQDGTSSDDYLFAAITTVDGNIVAAGHTQGSWSDVNDGWYDVVAVKLNVEDGEMMWTYQVR